MKNRRPGPTWLPGEIIQKLGPVTYLVDVFDDHPWKCHTDQLKECADIPTTSTSTNSPTPSSHTESAHTESDFTTIPVRNEAVDAGDRPEAVQQAEGPTDSADESTLASEIAGHKYPLRDRAMHQRHI